MLHPEKEMQIHFTYYRENGLNSFLHTKCRISVGSIKLGFIKCVYAYSQVYTMKLNKYQLFVAVLHISHCSFKYRHTHNEPYMVGMVSKSTLLKNDLNMHK